MIGGTANAPPSLAALSEARQLLAMLEDQRSLGRQLEKLAAAAKVDEIEAKDDCLVARVRPAKGGEAVLKEAIFAMAVEKNLTITEMHSVEGRLDELFRQITQRDVDG